MSDTPVASQATDLVLIGPMGAGKTTLGRAVADILGWQFVDSDVLIEEQFGPISELFASGGESSFRDCEEQTLAQLFAHCGAPRVISLGGGAVLRTANQRLLAEKNCVLITMDSDAAAQRLAADTSRPLLHQDPVTQWVQLYQQRLPIYHRLAQQVLDTSTITIDAAVRQLCQWADPTARARITEKENS